MDHVWLHPWHENGTISLYPGLSPLRESVIKRLFMTVQSITSCDNNYSGFIEFKRHG